MRSASVSLVDLDPGQGAALLGEALAGRRELLLARQMGPARDDPLLARDDLMVLHGVLPGVR